MKLNKSEFTKLIEGLAIEMFEKRVQHLNEDDIALDNNLIIDNLAFYKLIIFISLSTLW